MMLQLRKLKKFRFMVGNPNSGTDDELFSTYNNRANVKEENIVQIQICSNNETQSKIKIIYRQLFSWQSIW